MPPQLCGLLAWPGCCACPTLASPVASGVESIWPWRDGSCELAKKHQEDGRVRGAGRGWMKGQKAEEMHLLQLLLKGD